MQERLHAARKTFRLSVRLSRGINPLLQANGKDNPRPSLPHLLYLCDFPPGANSGGALVVDRHLRRLAREGWEVTVSVPAAALRPHSPAAPYAIRPLAARRFWWPPVSPRRPWTQRLRATLWGRAVVADRHWTEPPDAVLTVLWGPAALTAAHAARAWQTPLAVIVHDLFRETSLPPTAARAAARLERDVLAAAARVWPVSEEMSACLTPLARPGTISTLPPVPDDSAAPPGGWQPAFRAAPVIAHAGAFHGHQVEYLAAVARCAATQGGTLLVLTPGDNPALTALRATGVKFRHQPTFSTSAEALAFLVREASALTVMYPLDPVANSHSPTGFPSRVLEFSHLGLPILVAAPPRNPLFTWASRHGWNLVLDRADWSQLARLIDSLAKESSWRRLSSQMRALAASACNPETIHRQFLAELPRRVAVR